MGKTIHKIFEKWTFLGSLGGVVRVLRSQVQAIRHHFVHLKKILCIVKIIRGVHKAVGERRLKADICVKNHHVFLVRLLKVDHFAYHFHE